MRVAICGGGLQGVELCWLAHKAGWQTLLVDKKPAPPALHLADSFIHCDLTHPAPKTMDALSQADLIIPALENDEALHALGVWCAEHRVPFAFDPKAYAVSSSKLKSRDLFLRCDTPIPTPCKEKPAFPLIAKPSQGSGSQGVCRLENEEALLAYLPDGFATPGWIFESYCPGPSFSLEICGKPGAYRLFQVTDLLMDETFDCRGVMAPSAAPVSVTEEMGKELLLLANALSLHGLMDLEVILSPEGLRVLEIDARFPSQTPTAVWLSTGENLAEHLASCFIPYKPAPARPRPRPALYEHILCQDGLLCERGEHIMSQFGPLIPICDFWGADEALIGGGTPDTLGDSWAATLMFTGDDPEEIRCRRDTCLKSLQQYMCTRKQP